MKLRLEDGFREIDIVARRDLVEFHSEELAAAFFRRLLGEPANRIAMRRALSEEMGAGDLLRRSDEEVARWLARKVVFGDLRILAHDLPQRSAPAAADGAGEATPRQAEQAAKAEQSASPALAQPAPAPVSEEETDPLLADTDQAAQAATLQSAAESGAPLCEA
jgi:hypothetical protein